MYSVQRFEFTTEAPAGADVTIDQSTSEKQELLAQIARGFAFPDYFGKNWDAFIDCLGDLSWLEKPEAIIDHESMPQLPSKDLRLYLESLIDAAVQRAPDQRPRLRVVFRIRDHRSVVSALASSH